MSGDKNLSAVPDTGTVAQRSYSSLSEARGDARQEQHREGRVVLSICPMDERTYWQHDGHGKWNAAGAMYKRVSLEVPCE